MRADPLMVVGRQLAAVMALDGDLSADLIAFMLGTAAAEGRLPEALASPAGIQTGAFDCRVCGLPHFLEADADDCCSALLELAEADADGLVEQPADHHLPDDHHPPIWSQAASI